MPAAVDLQFVDETVARLGRRPDAVIPVLQALQDHYGFLPEEALRRVCESTDITPASITGVASFYDQFRHKPVGKHIIQICRGTACHVNGAERVEDALRRYLRIPAGEDTDANGGYTVDRVACLGCCTLAPVVRVGEATLGHATAEKAPAMLKEHFVQLANGGSAPSTEDEPAGGGNGPLIHIGLGSCCMAKGSDRFYHELRQAVAEAGVDVRVKRVGCVGMCHRTPLVEVALPGQASRFYAGLQPDQARNLVLNYFRPRGLLRRASAAASRLLDSLLAAEEPDKAVAQGELNLRQPEVSRFLERQVHIATEGFGKLDPLDLDEYVTAGGFSALARCVEDSAVELKRGNGDSNGRLAPEDLIALVERSGLRGRGGAGFPTARKWRVARAAEGDVKYVICNGDEGDPGAFMDRMLLESFPYRIIEGLAMAAVAVGAHEAILYIRHEYPLAVKRVRAALKLCRHRGWLGERLLGSSYPLNIVIKEGAGAFVCGEETALIESIEGHRGMPRLRPPFPAQQGLWDKPTVINNVETLALLPWIVRHGPEAFAAHGTSASKGTKVFALAGNVQRGGLIEVPMGTTIRQVVEEIGGGVRPGRTFKAVQIGGPSGGCIPARLADTPIDYESLRALGAIMGSGGLVVLDDSACMVDVARYFLQFTQSQSCGKCTFCRVGTRRLLDLLDRLCAGKGRPQDLTELERLCGHVAAGSLCGLGKTAPGPVLTTLRYFRHEYEAHIRGSCPAGKCVALIKYRVLENCTGCTLCAQHCPVDAIPFTPYERHAIDLARCTRCDSCRQVCPHNAIEVK